MFWSCISKLLVGTADRHGFDTQPSDNEGLVITSIECWS